MAKRRAKNQTGSLTHDHKNGTDNGTDNEAAPEAADEQSPLERARFGPFSWTHRCEVCGSA